MPVSIFSPEELVKVIHTKAHDMQSKLNDLQGTLKAMENEDWEYMQESGILKVESMLTSADNMILQARVNLEIAKDLRKLKGY